MAHHHCQNHHAHSPASFNKAFIIAIFANGLFVILQIAMAIYSNSTSLLADAVHNLGDVLGLVLAWGATRLLSKAATTTTTFGMKKTTILASLVNGIMLVFSCGIIATEAVYKLFTPTAIDSELVIMVAALGIVINGVTAVLFMRGKADLNIRAAYYHLLYDAVISVGVVVSASILYVTNWLWIDPVIGLLIAVCIVKGTWRLFTESFKLIIDGVPSEVSWHAVNDLLLAEPGVQQIHDLHIWAISTQENALSVHLYMPHQLLSDAARQLLSNRLATEHAIHHATFQIERDLSYCPDSCRVPEGVLKA